MLDLISKEYSNLGELNLIFALRHEISNFNPDFRIKVNKTLLLTPYASNLFGFGLVGETPAFGIPSALTEIQVVDPKTYQYTKGTLWDHFIRTRWYGVAAKPNSKAVYWLFDYGKEPDNTMMALRLQMRPHRVNTLLESEQVVFAKMDKDGFSDKDDDMGRFTLPVQKLDELFWEKE